MNSGNGRPERKFLQLSTILNKGYVNPTEGLDNRSEHMLHMVITRGMDGICTQKIRVTGSLTSALLEQDKMAAELKIKT